MLHSLQVLAQQDNNSAAGATWAAMLAGGCFMGLIYVGLLVLVVVGLWKMFVKAGKPGWASIIPFYNAYVMCEIAGKPGWWFLLFFIPLVGVVFSILVVVGIAKNFGKDVGFILGMIFLPFIFYPILGFGNAQYRPLHQPGFPVST